MTGHQLAAEPDRDLPDVDLSLPTRQVGLRDEHVGVAVAMLSPDLGSSFRDVGADGVVGDVEQLVFVG